MADDASDRVREQIAVAIEAFNRGDLEAMLVTYTPRSRYQVAREHPESRLCVGREEVAAYYRSWREQLDDVRIEVTSVEVEGRHCLLAARFIGRAGGTELAVPVFLVIENDDDALEVVSAEEFLDEREAERRFAELARL